MASAQKVQHTVTSKTLERGSPVITGEELSATLDLTGKAVTLDTPATDAAAATKGYVDASIEGLPTKKPVVTRASGNVDLAGANPNPIGGVTVTDGERVALFEQSTGPQDGIYVAVTAIDPSTWTRADDFQAGFNARGAIFLVEEGNDADKMFKVTNDSGADVVGTDALTLVEHAPSAPALHAATHVTGGTDVVPNAVAAGNAGLMTGADKTKLDGVEALADVTGTANVTAAGAVMDTELIRQQITVPNGATTKADAVTGGQIDGKPVFASVLTKGTNPVFIVGAAIIAGNLSVEVSADPGAGGVVIETLTDNR